MGNILTEGNWNEKNIKLLKTLVVGDSGAGKTSQLALLANAGYKVVIADFGNKLQSIANLITPEGAKNLYVKTFRDDIINSKALAWPSFKQEIAKGDWAGAGKIEDFDDKFVFAVDDLSNVYDAVKHYALASNGKKFNTRPTLPDFGTINDEMNAYIMDLLAGDQVMCHVVVNAHWQLVDDEYGASRYYPAVGTKNNSSRNSGRFFDNVIWLKVDRKGNRTFRTSGDGNKDLKVALSNKVAPEVNGDLAELYKTLLNR